MSGLRHTAWETHEAIPDILVAVGYLSFRPVAKVTVKSLVHLLGRFFVRADHPNHCDLNAVLKLPKQLSCMKMYFSSEMFKLNSIKKVHVTAVKH